MIVVIITTIPKKLLSCLLALVTSLLVANGLWRVAILAGDTTITMFVYVNAQPLIGHDMFFNCSGILRDKIDILKPLTSSGLKGGSFPGHTSTAFPALSCPIWYASVGAMSAT